MPVAFFTPVLVWRRKDAIIMTARAHWFDNEDALASKESDDASAKESPSEEPSAEEPLVQG